MASTVAALEAQLGDQYIHTGLAARHNGRVRDADRLFRKALAEFAKVPDPAQRRAVLGQAALTFESTGDHELALTALQGSLSLDEELQDHRHLAEDLLTLGNLRAQLGQLDEAQAAYERAVAICVQHGHLDHAATANTNLAILLANSQRLPQAIAALRQSLAYLLDHPQRVPAIEIHTRLALIQAVDSAQAEAEVALDAAYGLFERCEAELQDAQWQRVDAAFRRCVDRHLAALGESDPARWRAEQFPRVYARH